MKTKSTKQLNFFTDENFPVTLVEILRIFTEGRCKFETLRDHFQQGTEDLEWLTGISKMNPKPVVISGDVKILNHEARVAALGNASMHFVIPPKRFPQLPFREQVLKMLRSWDSVEKAVMSDGPARVFKITDSHNVEVHKSVGDVLDKHRKRRKRIERSKDVG